MKKSFRCPEIARLSHELSMSPVRHRLRQVCGILRAVSMIEPAREYPYAFICFHVTGYQTRRNTQEEVLLSGKAVIEDLVQLVDVLTAGSPLPEIEPTHDADALAERFKVSTKTISRWRKRGLVAAWYQPADGQPRLAFSTRAIHQFVARNLNLVKRGASFKLVHRDEKERIISRARELVASGHGSLHAVTVQLAEETGRAIETIRYTLRRFDQDCPQEALFDRAEKAHPVEECEVIHEAFIRGESIADLAARFDRDAVEIQQTLTTVRAKHLAARPIDYIASAAFDAPEAEEILDVRVRGDSDDDCDNVVISSVPSDLPAYLKELYRTPLLTADEERTVFMQMNYLLHKAEKLRQRVNPETATEADIAQVENLVERATAVKNRIIQANLRLVVSIAKRHLAGKQTPSLFELVSDGNVALMRAVEKFDYARGFRFSTYGSWAIMRSYARSVPDEFTRTDRFRTGHEEVLASTSDYRADEREVETSHDELRSTLADSLAQLDERERDIVQRRYGLAEGSSSCTLEEIGREIGVSKERVRQIELRALRKLRTTLGEQGADLLAG